MTRLLVGLLILSASELALADGPELPMATAARQRQEAIRTLDVRFRIERITEAGGELTLRDWDGVVQERRPAARTTGLSDNRFVLDGAKFRVEFTYPRSGAMRETKVFDGTTLRSCQCPEDATEIAARGYGSFGSPSVAGRSFPGELLPLVLASRGVDSAFSPTPLSSPNWRWAGDRTDLWGVRTEEFRFDPGTKSGHMPIWVDPRQGFNAVASAYGGEPGTGRYRLNISYHRDPESGLWLPTGWRATTFDVRGELMSTTTATVTSTALNKSIPDGTFTLAFPAGMRVSDLDKNANLVVSADGQLVPFRPNPNPTPPDHTGLIVVCVAVGVLLAVLVVVRVWSRRSPAAK